jgi:predicted NBD/HSP70 family sugar kinase
VPENLATVPPAGARVLPRPDVLRELTDESVLDVVFVRSAVTRAEIARQTGISKATINEAVRRLERAGLLVAGGSEEGRPGRAGTFYELASDAGFIIAADLGATGLRITATDLFGQSICSLSYPPPDSVRGVAVGLRRGVREAMARGARLGHPLRAVSVSIANPVDPASGRVVPLSDTPYPEGVIAPAQVLAGLFSAPLIVDNDVNLAAIAERVLGAGRSVDNFVYVYIGAGLGMGIVLNGSLVRGARGLAGEIGYLPVGPTSEAAHGRHRLARVAAAGSFARNDKAGARPRQVFQLAEAVFARAERGNAEAIELLEREGRAVGEAIAAVCATIDPQLVILGGPVGGHPALLPLVQLTVNELAPVPIPVLHGLVGENPSLRGAIAVSLQRARQDLLASMT